MDQVSAFVQIGFIVTTMATVWLFFKATKSNRKLAIGIVIWMILTSFLGLMGFYSNTTAIPPRFVFLLGPGVILVIALICIRKGRAFASQLDLRYLTILHAVRIPVELILYAIFLAGLIPDLMTFEKWNYDILSGLSAPVVYFLVFRLKKVGRKGLLVWNFICLALLINILTIAVLSAPTSFQALSHEQPNIGVTYFPFVWLPTVVVPLVLFSHLASITQLLSRKDD